MPGSGDRAAAEIWGTWEELLLAYAVRRHGVHRWDSVAMEVKERIASSHLITPEGCEERFRHLQRRFAGGRGGDLDSEEKEADEELPWLEELRRLRVAELRRELERRDVSITSLQHKVKRLKEERERSEREADAGGGEEPDLKPFDEGNGGETPRRLPTNRVSEGDSGRSCNESNSTDPKEEKPAMLAAEATDPAAAAGDEKSCNGSSEANPARTAAESAADSKGGARESSEAQSSASLLSRRRLGRRRKVVPSGRVEAETDAVVSPVNTKSADIKSGPLMAVLEMIRSSEHGSVFERRLQSQESSRYRDLIRRHVDLGMIRSKLESEAAYSSLELFRDLLLLCANATLFYAKRSPQSIAAVHLRRIITNQMATALPKASQPSKPLAAKQGSTLQQLLITKLRSDASTVSKPLVEDKKTASLPPLGACRKRSSMNSKGAARVGRKVETEEKTEEAGVRGRESEEESPAKKRTAKDRPQAPVTGTKGLRNNKNRGGDRGGGRSATPTPPSKPPPPRMEDRPEKVTAGSKGDKKNSNGSTTNKKGSAAAAAELLSRMKQRSQAGTAKSSASSTRGAEQKKGARPGGGSAVITRQATEKGGGGVKRGVGRPPKRTAKDAELAPRKRGRR